MNKINNIPIYTPDLECIEWLHLFATQAETEDGEKLDFRDISLKNDLKENVPFKLHWLNMNHGGDVINLPNELERIGDKYDAAVINDSGIGVAINTADCMPIIFVDKKNRKCAIAHAGWRGIVANVIENTLDSMGDFDRNDLLVWIGPSIGSEYEIGEDVYQKLSNCNNVRKHSFKAFSSGKYIVNFTEIAVSKIEAYGISRKTIQIYPKSVLHDKKFHSLRRDGSFAGRTATIVGIT